MNKITVNKKPVRLRINGILCNVTNINAGAIIYPPEPIIPPSPTSEWIGVELPFSPLTLDNICYGDGKFVGTDYKEYRSIYSTDGFNWELGEKYLENIGCSDITYGDGIFVCVGISGYGQSSYSYDGIIWEQIRIGNTLQNPSITYGNGKFVTLARINGYGYYSNDGIIWEPLSYPYDGTSDTIKYAQVQDIAYGNGVFVAVGVFSNIILYSKDGINWDYSRLDTSNVTNSNLDIVFLTSVCYGDGKFVTISGNDGFYSFDGINWTYFSLPYDVEKITYGDGKFVAIYGSANSGYSLISEDVLNWWRLDMPNISNSWGNVTYGDGKFVALSTDGKAAVLYSSEIQNPALSNRIGTARIGKARIAKEG